MFCLKCGNQIPDGATFCPACGEKSAPAAAPAPQPQAAPQYQAPVPPPQPQYQQPVQPQYQQPQYQAPYQQPVTQSDNSKLYKILSYVGILWLIGMFVTPEKDNPGVRFHVGQGIILSIAGVAVNIVVAIINAIITSIAVVTVRNTFLGYDYGSYTTTAGWALVITGILSFAAWAAIVALVIIGIVNAVKGEDKQLPVIGKFAFYK
ncbi:MAG: zinc ribbon domain-containing protein [Oscillospiraceae bacterium]|nr:zinc ribbon domain-containing protein [Oscillospiraceae bacterium]